MPFRTCAVILGALTLVASPLLAVDRSDIAGRGKNLLTNPGFEQGLTGWSNNGDAKAVTVDDLVAILRQLITWARGGDRWAIGLLFDYYLRLPARSNDDAHTLQGLVRLIENDGPGRR